MRLIQPSPALRWRAALAAAAIAASSTVGLALFTNGGFEDGTLSNWTKSTFTNPGLSGSAPYTGASIVRNAGGADWTSVVGSTGGGPLSVKVAETGDNLMVPRFGDHAAVINYPNGQYPSANANAIKQQATVQQADVDPLDGKVHVRLAFAPVLSDGFHSAHQQAWFFIAVRNKSRGDAILHESFAYANQPGVPWKVQGSYTYTDWQVVDIAPGNAQLAVGDVIELEAIASGCSQGGHAGWVYVDAFGSFIPGPSVVATAASLVNPGTPLTYRVTGRNQGTGALGSGIMKFTVPAQTTFASVSDTSACSQTAGVVTCNIGTLPAGSTYAFDVTVNVSGGAAGTISAGAYSIEGTGEPALLGPVVNTTVTSNPLTDLSLTIANGVSSVGNGQSPTYTVVARNLSSAPITGATVTLTPPAALTNVTWTCTASSGSACTASGSGAISDTVDLAANGDVTYTLTGTISGLTGTLSVAGSIAAPGGTTDQDPSNNSAGDNDTLQVNAAPVATADSYAVAEDSALVVPALTGVLANDSDGDGDPLTAVLAAGPTHGILALGADGSFTYTPAANYAGPDSFTYRASDGSATSAAVTVTLLVNAVDDAPTLDQPAPVSMIWTEGPRGVTLTGISAGGNEPGPVTVTVVSGTPGVAAISAVTYGGGSTASFNVTPTVGTQGSATITVTINDGNQTVTRTFTVVVSPPPFYVTRVYPAAGPAPGGTNIRIYGGGFTLPAPAMVQAGRAVAAAVTQPVVFINGVQAPVAVIESDGVVSAVTPALPPDQPLDVQLVVPAGTGTLVRAYTPYALPDAPVPPADTTQPTPDPTNPMDPTAPTTDSDGDGMTDTWEAFYGTDPFDATDATADPDGDGKTNLEEFAANTHPDGRWVRYFAEGNAVTPFRTWLNVYNASAIEAPVNVTFYLDDASVLHHLVKAPGNSRMTIDTGLIPALQGHAFGMRVEGDEALVMNRTITWNDQGVGATAERGVTLSPTWHFAEGATHSSLQTFLLVTNPDDTVATVEVEYLMKTGQSFTRTHVVPAHARATVWVNQEGPEWAAAEFGMVVRSSHPVVAERATYISSNGVFDAGETSVGVHAPALDWYFAEGVAGPMFDSYLLLGNPSDTMAEVEVRFLTDSGTQIVRTYPVGPRSRETVRINQEADWAPREGFGMHVRSTNGVAIVAERAMWWSTDGDLGWEEGHGSSGVSQLGTAYAIGDGVAGGAHGAATYVLIANPGQTATRVRVTVAFEDGTAPTSGDFDVAANGRLTLDIGSTFPIADGKRFSARVESLDATPIVVEQSMYWQFGTGTWKTGVSLPASRIDVNQ